MRIKKAALLVCCCLSATVVAFAQKKKEGTVQAVPHFKAPKLQTSLDNFKDTVTVSVDDAIRIIGQPIKVYDEKKNEYSISSYQFLYTKKGVTEDEDGKIRPTTTFSSDRFKVTPLPILWQNIIKEQVHSGEEFYFFDVIAKDTQGRVMYASNLKIKIK